MNKSLCFLFSILLPVGLFAREKADLIIYARAIYTVNPEFNMVESVVIRSGKILYAGPRDSVKKRYEANEILDLPNSYVFPGFIDAHCHFSGYALDAYKCDLTGTTSFEDVLARVKEYEKTNRLSWIYARGWDQNDWHIKEYPTKAELDVLFPDKPVILKRVDGHAILANQKALDMANITADTKIAGGIIEKKNSKLTGILIDNATEPVENLIPLLPKDEATRYLKAMEQRCFAEGLTGVVDCGVKKDVIRLLETLYKNNILTIGNSLLLSQDKETIGSYLYNGPVKYGQLQINGIKLYGDGALGSRGACLLKDYSDMPGHRGMLLSSYKDLDSFASNALKYNWQLCTHAIGDSGNRVMLDIYGYHLKGRNDRRWRIEHAQVVHRSDHSKFATYSIIPSVQPTHAISDMPWAEARLGAGRMNEAYAYRSLMKQNGWIALGTDFPVEEISPIATFYTAVARKDVTGKPEGGFLMNESLSRKDALMGMTIWAAKSVFLENEKGSIEAGKDADMVILDRDILSVPVIQIRETEVLYTIINGQIVFAKEKADQ